MLPKVAKAKNMKRNRIVFICTSFEKKLIKIKAKKAGLKTAEYCRKSAMDKEIKEILNNEHVDFYRMLIKYHNNFKRIGNIIKNKEPGLFKLTNDTALEIKKHLKNFK